MSGVALSVRPVHLQDAYALWLWANDPETRAASFGRSAIAWADHLRWLARAVVDRGQLHLVAELQDGLPVGSIRFDTADRWQNARLSYVVAPEARGQGLSRPLIRGGVGWLHEHRPGVAIYAVVMHSNPRSLRIFRDLGWEETAESGEASRFWLKPDEENGTDPD